MSIDNHGIFACEKLNNRDASGLDDSRRCIRESLELELVFMIKPF